MPNVSAGSIPQRECRQLRSRPRASGMRARLRMPDAVKARVMDLACPAIGTGVPMLRHKRKNALRLGFVMRAPPRGLRRAHHPKSGSSRCLFTSRTGCRGLPSATTIACVVPGGLKNCRSIESPVQRRDPRVALGPSRRERERISGNRRKRPHREISRDSAAPSITEPPLATTSLTLTLTLTTTVSEYPRRSIEPAWTLSVRTHRPTSTR